MTPLNWLTAISICFLPIGSCTSPGNAGYPSKLYFPASGDVKRITGKEIALFIYLEEPDGTRIQNSSDSCIILSGEWIEVTGKDDGVTYDISVEPNLTGKKRSIKLEIEGIDYNPTITIEQNKY